MTTVPPVYPDGNPQATGKANSLQSDGGSTHIGAGCEVHQRQGTIFERKLSLENGAFEVRSKLITWAPTLTELFLMCRGWAVLEGAVSKEKLDQVSFVRLQPVQLDRLDPANVQPVDVIRIEQLLAELGIFRDRSADQCGANGLDHLILWAFNNRSEREHVLGIREFGFG